MLLTFLRLLRRIVQVIESTKRETTEFIQNFFTKLTMGLWLDFEKTLEQTKINLFIRSITEFGILAIKDYMNLQQKRASSIKLQKFAAIMISE